MSQTESYPNTAYILSLIGGIFILLVGLFVGLVGAAFTFFLGGIGAIAGLFGIVWGIIIIVAAINLRSNPSQHSMWGAIILVFSLLSWVGSAGGFFIGFLLAFIGGILALVWSPRTYRSPEAYAPPPPSPPPASSIQYCPNCGAPVPPNVRYCPHCGKQLS